MSPDITSLVAVLGVKGAADRSLRAERLDQDGEDFFAANIERLPWRYLFDWLAIDPPEGASARPYGTIIARIAVTIDASEARFGFFSHPDVVRRVRDAHAREELIEALRPKLDKDSWLRNLGFASMASDVFNKVRDIEARVFHNPGLVQGIATLEGKYVWLITPGMFDARRDPKACLRMLRDAALDPTTRHYALWLLDQTELLPRAGDPVEDLLGEAPTQSEIEILDERKVEEENRARVRLLVRLADRWLGAEAKRDWFVRRYLRAMEAGTSWHLLWCEVEPELRDDVALASLETDHPAPWALAAIDRRMNGGIDAWNRVFAILDRVVGETEGEAPESRAFAVFDRAAFDRSVGEVRQSPDERRAMIVSRWTGRPIGAQELDRGRRDFPVRRTIWTWMDSTPLPPEADDDFDQRLLRIWRRFRERSVLDDVDVASKLQHLPLTLVRARRILDLTLSTGQFWGLEKAPAIAKTVGVITATVPLPHDWVLLSATTVAVFQDLVGAAIANQRLGQWLDDLADTGNLQGALHLSGVEPSILTDGRRAALRQLALKEGVDAMIYRLTSHPWLVTERDVVDAVVDDKHDWRWLRWWSEGLPLPQFLAPIVEAIAVSIVETDTATALLDQLEKLLGRSRRDVLALALERLRKRGPSSLPVEWLARKLNTKSLWDDSGKAIVAVLLAPHDEEGARRVLGLCVHGPVLMSNPRLEPAMHTAVGGVLLDLAEHALRAQNSKLAKDALTGLARLSPTSRLRGGVRRLRGLPGADAFLSLIEVNERFLRRTRDGYACSLDDIRGSLRVLVHGDGDDGDDARGEA